MNRIKLLFLILLLPITILAANTDFLQVQNNLANFTNLSGKFKQTQKIQLLTMPLESTGNFVLSKKNGLSWYQNKPFEAKLLVNSSKIIQQLGNNTPIILTKENQPAVFFFTNIFLALFNGQTNDLNDYFRSEFSGTIDNWQVILTPITTPLDKAIVNIILTGSKYVNTIVVNEAKNNQLAITFYDVISSNKN